MHNTLQFGIHRLYCMEYRNGVTLPSFRAPSGEHCCIFRQSANCTRLSKLIRLAYRQFVTSISEILSFPSLLLCLVRLSVCLSVCPPTHSQLFSRPKNEWMLGCGGTDEPNQQFS